MAMGSTFAQDCLHAPDGEELRLAAREHVGYDPVGAFLPSGENVTALTKLVRPPDLRQIAE
jgi:hypothetical protein